MWHSSLYSIQCADIDKPNFLLQAQTQEPFPVNQLFGLQGSCNTPHWPQYQKALALFSIEKVNSYNEKSFGELVSDTKKIVDKMTSDEQKSFKAKRKDVETKFKYSEILN